ncbi:DUF5366 family protein [Bacillus sp. CECT 9360]|uniref:DUF5366 family protein n=1 Tax=Bacillus sp. CECT 9360 TaxID=2845821 RepID=UPI001E3144BE|nr:DUF5366 family protein [Bacillus sp. CECT 9360]CAH0344613.1 hypothetical protein BCI9360_00873 [Bacillus sp. CECT 9360]
MKNTYLIGYFPLIAIVLFSLSFAIYGQMKVLILLKNIGIYDGMLEFVSETGIKLSLLIVMFLICFMLFSALKLISDTIIELSLLFFSKDSDGDDLKNIRMGAMIYFIGGVVSLVSVNSILGLAAIFLGTTVIAFIYLVYKISPSLTTSGLIGLIFFDTFIWLALVLVVAYSSIRLYNSMMASLPL